jgi:hypothetical protein
VKRLILELLFIGGLIGLNLSLTYLSKSNLLPAALFLSIFATLFGLKYLCVEFVSHTEHKKEISK